MFSSTSHKIVCVLIILSTAVLAHSQSVPAKEATGVISGKVTIKGKPAAGVVILLRLNDNAVRASYKGTTDVDGEYRIANVPAGNYTIAPLAPALVDANGSTNGFDAQRPLLVNKGETVENIDFALVRGGAITGKVVDADGHPVVEQEVRVYVVGSNSPRFSNTGTGTDDRGVYRFYGLKAGRYKVATGQGERGSFSNRMNPYRETYYPSVAEADQATVIEVSEGSEAADIDITVGSKLQTYTASGRIVDGVTGQPVRGVAYGLKHFISQYSTYSTSTGVVSNRNGEFRLEGLAPGKYAVEIIRAPTTTWRADEVAFEIVDEDVSGLVVQTKKAAALSGVVVIEGPDDKYARNELRRVMLLAASGPPDGRGASAWSKIGPDGTFSLSGLAGGPATLQLGNSSRFRIVRIERNGVVQGRAIEVKEGEETGGVRLFLAYGSAIIRGTVEITNGPVPAGARLLVTVRNVSDDPAVASYGNPSVEADARGQFVVEGVFPGTYEIGATIWSPDGHTSFSEKNPQIAVLPGSTSNVTLSLDLKAKTTRP